MRSSPVTLSDILAEARFHAAVENHGMHSTEGLQPINKGRRQEKEARAIAKAEAKRARKAAKRLRDASK